MDAQAVSELAAEAEERQGVLYTSQSIVEWAGRHCAAAGTRAVWTGVETVLRWTGGW